MEHLLLLFFRLLPKEAKWLQTVPTEWFSQVTKKIFKYPELTKTFHPSPQVSCFPAQVMRHLGCTRSRSRRWVTALVAASTRSPAGTLLGSSQSRLHSARSSQGGDSARNSYTSCHQPIFRLPSLKGMHWVQPRQNQTCSCLLCPGRRDLRGRQVNAAPRGATSNLVLLMDCSSRTVACTWTVFSVANPNPTCLPRTLWIVPVYVLLSLGSRIDRCW